MWIRSQEKTELVNTQRIQAEGVCIYAFENVAIDDCSYIKMGEYSTEEKAIKVLDKIQEFMGNQECFKGTEESSHWVVYEMPENESKIEVI